MKEIIRTIDAQIKVVNENAKAAQDGETRERLHAYASGLKAALDVVLSFEASAKHREAESRKRGNLYLVEFYTKDGMDIEFAWVYAEDNAQARMKMRMIPVFEEVILCDEQSDIFALSGVKVAYFIDDSLCWRV